MKEYYYRGKVYSQKELSEFSGINADVLRNRIEVWHWSVHKAITTPLRTRNDNNSYAAQARAKQINANTLRQRANRHVPKTQIFNEPIRDYCYTGLASECANRGLNYINVYSYMRRHNMPVDEVLKYAEQHKDRYGIKNKKSK